MGDFFRTCEREKRNFRLKEGLPGNAATSWMTYGDGVESVRRRRRRTPTWSDDRGVVCRAPNPVKSKGAGAADRNWQGGGRRVGGTAVVG